MPSFSVIASMITGILIIHTSPALAKRRKGELCNFNGTFTCKEIPRHLISKITLPPQACIVHNCDNCVITKSTYLIDDDYQLLHPDTFTLQANILEYDSRSSIYKCTNVISNAPCECADTNCNGPEKFCAFRNCISNSTCQCTLTQQKPELIAITSDKTFTNPTIITFYICFFKKPTHVIRKLLEGENAVFSNSNMTITFHDPILTLPGPGRLIIRNPDYEHLTDVPHDLMVNIPFELLAFKSTIDIIYINPSGRTVSGQIHVSGKTICQLKYCILCRHVLKHVKCLPTFIQYIIYALLFVGILLSLLCVKVILKSILFIMILTLQSCYIVFKCFKLIARGALLIGAYIGSSLKELSQNLFATLERHAAQRAQIPLLPLILFIFGCTCCQALAECNTHAIIKSDLSACQTMQDGTKQCDMHTTAEITLKTISSESCLYFTDENGNHLFTLAMKLDSVLCTYNTKRSYFTFPVKTKHLTQLSCIFNRWCGRGTHCQKRKIGKTGLKFEAETPESRTYPGVSSCLPGGIGTGCTILTRSSCNFFRVWYEPDLLKSYEVSSITGHKCQYHIAVTSTENNTVSRLMLSDSAYTKKGIKITILGAFDQPHLHLTDKFIQRVGNPAEAYLAPACDKNFPIAGQIGAVQANISYTTDFIFDPDLTQCDFFEDVLRCTTAGDALQQSTLTKEYALPIQRDIHLFQVKGNTLQSSLLMSSAVKVQLHFKNYKIAVKTSTICPQFDDESIQVTGCYKCPILARLSIKAHSTCQEGVVAVQFQTLQIFTQAITLRTEPNTHIIKFSAEEKCYAEKLCLKSSTLIQCIMLEFCLDEPSVQLISLDTNYTKTTSSQTPYNFWDYLQFPNLNSTFFIFKFIGSILLIICLVITAFSTIITCCCRTR